MITIYYAALSGSDIQSFRQRLNATTLTGAKREAGRKLGGGYRHHMIYVGELIDAGTMYERGRALASRAVGGGQWRDEE